VCDGGIMIDLSRMKSVRVDPNGTARAEPGLSWGEFYQQTQAFGLATTGGVCSTPGIAGVTLGGGFGWLMRKYGLSCDNLLSADVVTADGRLLKASGRENADLFWGLRGGNGNFGVVTSLEYRLHPVGTVLSGMVLHPLSRAKDVLKFYREYADSAPEDLTVYAAFLVAPDRSPMVAIPICYHGPSDAGEKIVRPLRTFGPPAVDQIQPMTYLQCESLFDAANPAGRQNYWRSNLLPRLSDEAIETLIARFQSVPSPQSSVLIEHLGGAVSRIPKDATAFRHRDARHSFVILSMWSDPAESQQQIQWTDEFWKAMRPFSSEAVQVNYLGEEGEARVKAAYGSNYQRLVALKKKYDPANLFRVNQNIQSAASG
jgi:FAD/FMN-containing dehydrogenase